MSLFCSPCLVAISKINKHSECLELLDEPDKLDKPDKTEKRKFAEISAIIKRRPNSKTENSSQIIIIQYLSTTGDNIPKGWKKAIHRCHKFQDGTTFTWQIQELAVTWDVSVDVVLGVVGLATSSANATEVGKSKTREKLTCRQCYAICLTIIKSYLPHQKQMRC